MTNDPRALDREVAEKVIDEQRIERVLGGFDKAPTRHYSTDPAACALVKKRLRDAGIHFEISWMFDAVQVNGWHKHNPPLGDIEKIIMGSSVVSEEEAVCRFALACYKAGHLPTL